jgi:hypothetical protein
MEHTWSWTIGFILYYRIENRGAMGLLSKKDKKGLIIGLGLVLHDLEAQKVGGFSGLDTIMV